MPWAALRVGLSGRDWASEWLDLLQQFGLPGTDFVLLAPSLDFTAFKQRIANFYDAQAALRILLMYDGTPATEAVTYSCHS